MAFNKITPATQAEIAEVARKMVAGKVIDAYSVAESDPHMLGIVFMPLTLGALEGATEKDLEEIAIFGVIGKHHILPRYINDWPIFFSCNIWRREDYLAAFRMHEKMKVALATIASE